jgi:hypothetical protein
MERLKLFAKELLEHAPFTALGAVTGIILMVIIIFTNISKDISSTLFYTLHPLHVLLSALVTTSMYKRYEKGKLWLVILIGYTGSIGIDTLSDIVIPYLGVVLLNVPMEFHLPFLEAEKIPFLGLTKWQLVNGAAIFGIAIAFWKPVTRLPHMGHVLVSTWASLFAFTAFATGDWFPLLPFIFIFLFFAVWLPCCVSDIIYPLIFVRNGKE